MKGITLTTVSFTSGICVQFGGRRVKVSDHLHPGQPPSLTHMNAVHTTQEKHAGTILWMDLGEGGCLRWGHQNNLGKGETRNTMCPEDTTIPETQTETRALARQPKKNPRLQTSFRCKFEKCNSPLASVRAEGNKGIWMSSKKSSQTTFS